jgi:transcriptional regulator with XRE-family HTH domain
MGKTNKNQKAVDYLRELSFPLLNIRTAMPKLTGITQPKVAKLVGLSRVTIAHYLTGRLRDPEAQRKIADTYGVSRESFFTNEYGRHSKSRRKPMEAAVQPRTEIEIQDKIDGLHDLVNDIFISVMAIHAENHDRKNIALDQTIRLRRAMEALGLRHSAEAFRKRG